MSDKLKLFSPSTSWEATNSVWDARATEAAKLQPLKKLKQLPEMVGITQETAKGLKWKSLKWMISQDEHWRIMRGFLKHPFKHGWAWLRSIMSKKSYRRDGDFFLYGIDSLAEFEALLLDSSNLFVLGFSYCHKPFECPSGRFSPNCKRDPENLVCQQCFIGKALHHIPPELCHPLLIPTIHYVGGQIFDLLEQHPHRRLIFMITACELTLEMFGDWGNMVNIKGVGVRLAGRICNTMKAFELSEQGIKPGLTVIPAPTQKTIMDLLRLRTEQA
jgi:hypothetical protein